MSERKIRRRTVVKAGLLVAGGAAVPGAISEGLSLLTNPTVSGRFVAGPTPWNAANQIIANVEAAVGNWPSATFPITNYGATPGGDNTNAFKAAIAACNAAGGGHVTVPAGTWTTGAIHLLSNVDLHMEAGATISFSSNMALYPTVSTSHEGFPGNGPSPNIYADSQTNIGVTGSGLLLGPGATAGKGAQFVEPHRCTNVLLQGFTVHGSQWWNLHPSQSTNVLVDGVTVVATAGNTDGCDPEWSQNVVIRNCSLTAGDDCIAIKAGCNAQGAAIGIASKNLVIYNNQFTGPWGGVTCGSEESCGVSDVYVYNCKGVNGGPRYMLYAKANDARGGYVKNVNFDSFSGSVHGGIVSTDMNYASRNTGFLGHPIFDGFWMTNCNVTCPTVFAPLAGQSASNPLMHFYMQNCTFSGGLGSYSNVTPIGISNVTAGGQMVNIGTYSPPPSGPPATPTASPTQGPLTQPQNARGSSPAAGQLVAMWDAPASDGGSPVSGYAIYIYGADGSSQEQVTTGNSYTANGLNSNVYYTFTVTAYNGKGWSGWSNWASWTLIS